MNPRPRLLFLGQCLPYPPTSGVTNRTYHILVELQREFDVTLLAFSRRNHQGTDETRRLAQGGLARDLSVVAKPVTIKSEWSAAARAAVHLGSLVSGRCYVDLEYESGEFADGLRRALDVASPDLVHIDSLDLHRWAGRVGDRPVVCTHHSIESDLLRLRANHHANRLLRPYLRLQAARYERLERRLAPKFAANVMMSDIDAQRLRALAPSARTICVPNGVDTDRLQPAPEGETIPDVVSFLGPSYMYPNRDGMEFFLGQIWPVLQCRRPATTLEWIGRMSESDRLRTEQIAGVRCLGFVEDLRAALARAACLIVPLRIGGGTRLKILDAWAMGKAIVSTSIGCEGLAAVDGENILIRDEPEAFAMAVDRVLGDPALRNRLGESGRRTVEQHYSWDAIGERMNAEYAALIGR